MPQHKSAIKRVRTSAKANERNRAVRSAVRTAIKRVRTEKNPQSAIELLKDAHSRMDRAVRSGVLKKQTVARLKSRLAHHTAKLAAAPVVVAPVRKKKAAATA